MINLHLKRILAVLAPAALALAPFVALAQTEAESPQAMTSPVSLTNVLSLVTSLIFVVGAILFVGWIYSRMRGVNLGASKAISVLAAQPLGPKEKIVVVQIGTKQIAVGMTPSSMETLLVFDEPVIQQREGSMVVTFSERFRNALGRSGSK